MSEKKPNLLVSLIPLVFLVFFLCLNVYLYKDNSSYGPNQLALILSAVLGASLGVFYLKQNYKKIELEIIKSIGLSMQANIILLVVGALIGVWIMSGIVPAMIFYGLKLINPTVFLPVACLVCCIVAVATGSSWSTTGTVGIALIAIGKTLGFHEGMVAGAIISGAYFGDKMSPLSDTTNLASAMAGVDLFEHIRHMLYTTLPAIALALIGFAMLGMGFVEKAEVLMIKEVNEAILGSFSIGPHLLIVPVIVLILVAKKMPPLPALVVGLLLGALSIPIFQSELMLKMSEGGGGFLSAYKLILKTTFDGFAIETGNQTVDSLFSRGGMSSMLNTVWLILSAMIFGGVLEATGMLERIAKALLTWVRGAGSLVGTTLASCLFVNATTSDQYISIVVPGRMFKRAFEEMKLHPKNLSRALEDAGTVTSVLIPWNTGGAYNSAVLGVATLTYLPFCFFNILSPIISAFLASMGWTIVKLKESRDVS